MKCLQQIAWWYWMLTTLVLAAALGGWQPGYVGLIGLNALQTLHFLLRERSITAFPVQVRGAYLGLLLLGCWEPLGFIHWIQLVGTLAMVLVDYCPLARCLSLLPWNRRAPLTLRLVLHTFLQPPRESVLAETA